MKRFLSGGTLIAGLQDPILVITGGMSQNELINDLWIFNVEDHLWTMVFL